MNESEQNFYIDTLRGLIDSHSSSITRNSQFLGYGTLVALFHYGKCFFFTYPVLACATALFSIASLALIYIFSLYYFLSSNSILELKKSFRKDPSKSNRLFTKKNSACEPLSTEAWIKVLYTRARKRAMVLFWSFQVALILAVGSFILSSGFYFFGEKVSVENRANCNNFHPKCFHDAFANTLNK